jgi:diguanylate cyclase (GGDEF)-like protein/PAS domain S-box-containing protein
MLNWNRNWAVLPPAKSAAALAVALAVLSFMGVTYGATALIWGLIFTAGVLAGWWVAQHRPGAPSAADVLHAKVFQSTTEGATITDAKGLILAVNNSFTRLTGYAPEDVIGKNPSILSSGQHEAGFYKTMWSELLAKGSWEGEVYNQRKDGEVFAEWLRISQVTDAAGTATNYVGIFSDISARKASEEKLLQHAYSDALTGLANRPNLHRYLDHEIYRIRRRGGCLACLFLDLDNFKPINDRHGHDAGDIVLKVIAGRIKVELREMDLASRIGGDEFVVALPDCGSADYALQIANRVLAVIRRPISWQGQSFQVGCSGGIALYPDHADDRNSLIAAADKAMYQAKGQFGSDVALADQLPQQHNTATG